MVGTATTDRAIELASLARSAEEAFVRLTSVHAGDELSPEWLDAEARWLVAEQAFADAVPTTRAGTLLKLDALFDLLRAAGAGDDSLELRHLRTVTSWVLGAPMDRFGERVPVSGI